MVVVVVAVVVVAVDVVAYVVASIVVFDCCVLVWWILLQVGVGLSLVHAPCRSDSAKTEPTTPTAKENLNC